MDDFLILTIDVGTSSCKTMVYDRYGNLLSSASKEHITIQKETNSAEQDPNEWLIGTIETIRKATENSHIRNRIGILGFTGQMHSAVLVNQSGDPLSTCMIYTDRRSVKQCNEIEKKISPIEVNKITGNRLDPYITAPKIIWLKENQPNAFRKMYKFLPPKDFIRMKMTGEFVTDPIEASGTLLYDIRRKEWSQDLFSIFDLPIDAAPEVHEPTEIGGRINEWASKSTGLKEGTPIIVGAADDIDFLGSGQIRSGDTGGGLGSAGEISSCVDKPIHDPLLRLECYPHVIDGLWVIGGSTSAAGTSIKWFKDNLGEPESKKAEEMGITPYELLFEEAKSIDAGANGLVFLPYLLGERCPLWDSKAAGLLFGLRVMHNKKHIMRAIMEGVTFSLMNILEVIEELGVKVESLRFTNQAASSSFWRQMIADVTGKEVQYTGIPQASSYGIMMLAAVNLGYYRDISDACEKLVSVKMRQEPDPILHQKYMKHYRLYKQLYIDLKQDFQFLQ